jgi:YVTN family beta-propeller protein
MKLLALLFAAILSTSAPVCAEVAVVLNSGDGSISLIDKMSMKETKRIPVGKEPHHLMATPDDQLLIIANAASNDLVFLDPKTGEVKRRLDGISDPYQIGFSPDRKWFVSVSLRLDRVDLYSGSDFKLVKRLPLPKTPSHVIFDAASQYAFITLQDSNEIAAIDLKNQTVAWKMPVGKQPAGIWMTPDDKHLLIGMTGDNYVEVVDWRQKKSLKKIKTGEGAHNFLPLGDGRRVLLSNRVANTVSVIDQNVLEVVDTISVKGGPDCMELTADGKHLWVTARWARKVAVVDMATKQTVKEIPVGKSPHGIYFRSHAARR